LLGSSPGRLETPHVFQQSLVAPMAPHQNGIKPGQRCNNWSTSGPLSRECNQPKIFRGAK